MDQGIDAHLGLDHQRQGEGAHADARHRAVADVDGVRAGLLDELGAGDAFRRIEAPRRIDLDADDELVIGEPLREGGGGQLLRGV